jgi:NADPH:quinone reductase-like Zn-dependent oxidoreductase
MRGILHRRYGAPEGLELRDDLAKPAVGDHEVLVRVHAAGVDPGVLVWLHGKPALARPASGLVRPRRPVLGRALAGRVEAVGGEVTQFQVGDEVWGEATHGAYAEYAAVPVARLAPKPAGLTFEQAAAFPVSATTALQALDKGGVGEGTRVLVNGASGGVGSFVVQLAKARGAEVTAVCGTASLDLVRSLGADHAIDYTSEDFTHSSARYDVLVDLAGSHAAADYRRVLTEGGTAVLAGGPPSTFLRRLFGALTLSLFVSERFALLVAKPRTQDLDALAALVEEGKLAPAVDTVLPLADVPEALLRLERGGVRGKLVIAIDAAG